MSAFNIWRENPPPRDTVVMAKYALTGDKWVAQWQLVRTCKRGCCVYAVPSDGMGSMILPKYWREASVKEAGMASTSTRAEEKP